MLYLDYSRKEGEWIANEFGGRENLAAVKFLQEATATAYKRFPGIMMIAEESTAWAGVTKPTSENGLGFGFKWNMGWMHDSLQYLSHDPIHRLYHHNEITFSILYTFSENFLLPLSHDEVVHGKAALVNKFPGDRWQKVATLRALYGYMWSHPGKKLLFMGSEFAQNDEWSHEKSLDWHLTQYGEHKGVQDLVRDLNSLYRQSPALWQRDSSSDGFTWLVGDDGAGNTLAYLRSADDGSEMISITNFSPVPHEQYHLPIPKVGKWVEILNTDDLKYGGSGVINSQIIVEKIQHRGFEYSAVIRLASLATIWLKLN
jgi:1,4-alpha-glucan branching enzyme